MIRMPATDDVFLYALQEEDQLGVVVRTHIHIEARVNRVIDALTRHPNHLPNLHYAQLIKLAAALGLNEEILPPLRELGDIRNKFAHSLEVPTLTNTMVEQLWKAFSEQNQKVIMESHTLTCEKTDSKEIRKYEETDARHRFIMMAITIDRYLLVEEKEARNSRNAT